MPALGAMLDTGDAAENAGFGTAVAPGGKIREVGPSGVGITCTTFDGGTTGATTGDTG